MGMAVHRIVDLTVTPLGLAAMLSKYLSDRGSCVVAGMCTCECVFWVRSMLLAVSQTPSLLPHIPRMGQDTDGKALPHGGAGSTAQVWACVYAGGHVCVGWVGGWWSQGT